MTEHCCVECHESVVSLWVAMVSRCQADALMERLRSLGAQDIEQDSRGRVSFRASGNIARFVSAEYSIPIE